MKIPSKNKNLTTKSVRKALATILDEYRAASPTTYPHDSVNRILEVLGIARKVTLTQKYEIKKTYCRERDENGNQIIKSRLITSGWLDEEGNSYDNDLPRVCSRILETDEDANITKARFSVF